MSHAETAQKAIQEAALDAAGRGAGVLGDGALPGRGVCDPAGLIRLADRCLHRLSRHDPIATAPRDGQTVEVFLACDGVWTDAYWEPLAQSWVRAGDPGRRALPKVTHWRRPLD